MSDLIGMVGAGRMGRGIARATPMPDSESFWLT